MVQGRGRPQGTPTATPQKVAATIKKASIVPSVSVTMHVQRKGVLAAVSSSVVASTTVKSLLMESLRLVVGA